jgi:hypothetical protein
MKTLSIASAWDETVAFVRGQPGTLFLIAFGFVSLPTIIFQAASPTVQPGQAPPAGPWMLLFIPVFILSIIGTLTVSRMALNAGSAPGDAFRYALRRAPAALGAALLLGLAFALLAFPLSIIMALVVPTAQTGAALALLLLMLVFAFVWVRLMLLSPIAVSEPIGPAAILKRSWAHTAGHFWKLLGFLIIFLVAYLIVLFAVNAVLGSLIILLAGQPQEGSLSSVLLLLVGGILNAILGLFLSVMIARIYAQLAGGTTGT